MAKRLIQSHSIKGATFDPNRNVPYKWGEDDIFEITGQQFAAIYHALTSQVRTPGGAPIFLTYEAYQAIMSIFAMGVQQGVIYEMETEQTDSGASVKALFGENKSQ